MKTILNVKNLTKNFGGLCAVSNVSMTINKGELIGLIGPNGAGKTTLFNLLTGVYEPSSGLIELMDQDKSIQIGGLKPYKITNLGVARTFQNIRLFKSMTVLENVKVAIRNSRKIRIYQEEIGNSMIEYKGFKYYKDNPDLTINECVEIIFSECGINFD